MSAYECLTFFSHAPIVKSESGPFVRWADLSGGLGVYGVVTFNHEIVWLRESSTRLVVLDAGGNVLHDGASFNDFYGYLGSQDEAADDAQILVGRFGATKDGPLSVEAILKIEERPAVVAPKDRFDSVYKAKYRGIPDDWCRPDDGAFVARCKALTWDERLDLDPPAYLRRRTIFEAPIWSSRNGLTDADQTQLREIALTHAVDGLSDDEADKARIRFGAASASPTDTRDAQRGKTGVGR